MSNSQPPEPNKSDALKGQHTRHLALDNPIINPVQRVTGPLDQTLPWVIELRFVGTASTLQVRVRDLMIIGRRSDNTSSGAPAIDLTTNGAFSYGVSRQHAVIGVKEQKLMLKDLGSTNGTRLNDLICEPGKEYRLRHGDELMLGRLRLQVSFAVVPDEAAMNTPIPMPKSKPPTKPSDTKPTHKTGETAAPMPKPSATTADLIKSGSHPAIPTSLVLGKGERVLIIEGDEDVGAVFEIALQQAGFVVTRVTTVARGLAIIFQQMPDAIVLDLLLPDMNGLDLVRYVRKQKTTKRVPLLVVSSATAGFQSHQALDAGADIFLGKPLAVEELIRAVAKTMKGGG